LTPEIDGGFEFGQGQGCWHTVIVTEYVVSKRTAAVFLACFRAVNDKNAMSASLVNSTADASNI
jgi:hypothetical protein